MRLSVLLCQSALLPSLRRQNQSFGVALLMAQMLARLLALRLVA